MVAFAYGSLETFSPYKRPRLTNFAPCVFSANEKLVFIAVP